MSNELPDARRRQVMGGMAAGIAGAGLAPAAAAAQAVGTAPASAAPIDPTTRYPRPPFPPQKQSKPGLAGRMTPRPDHGETSYRGSGRLAGRKALVTGGDSGIGRAAAIAFAREGADVAIGYLPVEEPDAREVIALIRAEGRRAVAVPGDISNEGFCRRMVAQAARELGGLDILVSNAAYQNSMPDIADITSEQFDQTFKVNVYATFWIVKAALPLMKPGASIIITSSVQAYNPSASLFDYAATKAAQVAMTKSLAKQLGPRGIRVNAVAPGPYWTPLQPADNKSPEEISRHGANTPLGRAGQPAEIAATYVLLASNESSYSTGQVLGASGGNGQP